MERRRRESEPDERPFRGTGIHFGAEIAGFSLRLSSRRVQANGDRGSVVEMIEKNRKALELELGKTVR